MATNPVDIDGLRIVHWPDPILTQRCGEIEFPDDPHALASNMAGVAAKMLGLMHRAPGVGLAASQVGLAIRMFVWSVDGDEGAVVNPVLSDPAGEDSLVEGCLSLPGVHVEVRRPTSISMSGLSVGGDPLPLRRADGLLARVWQHECDHLDGLTLVHRMTAADKIESRAALRSLKLAAKRADRKKKKGK